MASFHIVLPWVLACVLVGLGIGFYLGSSLRGRSRTASKAHSEQTLRVLSSILSAAEQLNNDVDTHNNEIQQVGQSIIDMHVDDDTFHGIQDRLLTQIASVLEANHKLEDDLQYATLRMEEQAQELDRTRKEARIDLLSGVANRKGFDEKLQTMLGAFRRQGRPFVLAVADVDHFKWINDTHGHPAGDRVVSGIGEFLRTMICAEDYVARFGGDEFAIFLQTDLVTGMNIIERIRAGVSKKNFGLQSENNDQAAVTFSIGVTGVMQGDTPESIFLRADQALYRSKQTGRNRVTFLEDNDTSRPSNRSGETTESRELERVAAAATA
ncbi:MAG: GGDEF domain-containing protein [Planctomycetia bacterium]|nr:GGDEF domain-containing protein [Planctomycetia bacterium]